MRFARHCLGLGLAVAIGAMLLAPIAQAESLRDLFTRGNAAFARGAYDEAARAYEELIEAGIDDPDVCFNLASAYGASGKYGQAIRYFERTLRLRPRDEAAESGLKTARDALGERQALAHGEAIVVSRPPMSEAIFAAFTSDGLAATALVCAWLAAGLVIALRRMRMTSGARAEATSLALGIAAALAAALALIALFGLGTKLDWGREGTRAVVLREGSALREGPDERARLVSELVEGEAVRVLAREGRYTRISARGQQAGYVRSELVGEI